MKILVLSSSTITLLIHRIDMMKSFVAKGYEVIAAGPDNSVIWSEKFAVEGIKYKQIYVSRTGLNPFKDIRTLISLYQLIKEIKPNKIFVYLAKTISYGCLAARLNHITDIYPLIAGLGSVFRGHGIKNKFAKTIMKILYKKAFSFSKKVFFQNKDDRDELIKYKLLSLDKTILINGSGVNLDKFKPCPLPKQPTFLCIGRLIKDKGIVEYLKACKIIKSQFPNICCLLVGPFDTNPTALKQKELQPYIDAGVVKYFGTQSDVRPFIAQCSTFVLPSYHEGTPKTVLESMAMGRAIITSDAPGCRETIIDGKNGFLIPTKNVNALVDKMAYLIMHPDITKSMGRLSYKIAVEKYDVNKVNATIMETMKL